MRRDYVTLEVTDTDAEGGERPTVVLSFDGPTEELEGRLVDDGETLDRDQVDVAFRYRTAVDADDASGVLSLTNRLTGAFVLEVNALAADVLDLVDAARTNDDPDTDGCYRVVLREDDETLATYEKRTLLVYDDEGDLLRQHSLIPGGVEL